jgi:formate-dependent nitrite reductase membrane component NrfD
MTTLWLPAAAPVTGNPADPHWYWWIIFYFFIGGIAGGAFLMAAIADFFGDRESQQVVRVGYLLALPLISLCGILLILDLGEPLRFWHMLVNVTTMQPAFKYWSPMSYGSWILTGFGMCSALAFLLALGGVRGIRLPAGETIRKVVGAVGSVFALLFVSYTGVLLNATNQRVWGDNTILGALFAVSGISTGIAAIILVLSLRRGHAHGVITRLERADLFAVAVEIVLLLALVAILVAAGSAGALIGGGLGILFWGGVLVAGLLVPLVLYLRPRLLGGMTPLTAATLALIGGFILRAVVLFSAHA